MRVAFFFLFFFIAIVSLLADDEYDNEITNAQPAHAPNIRSVKQNLADQPLLRIVVRPWRWRWLRNYFAFDRSQTIMEGGDSNDPEAIDRAADDYELLAANYARQPAADSKEDGCRWMAHELHRRAAWVRSWQAVKESSVLGRVVSFVWWLVIHVLGRWLIQRTAVGYLLDWWRPLITGAIVILLCALLYGVGAGERTIFYSDDPNNPLKLWNEHPVGNPLYFSVVTFTSLGYGDIQPKGWFKFLTAAEALTGVCLMALFTVSWARKMVR